MRLDLRSTATRRPVRTGSALVVMAFLVVIASAELGARFVAGGMPDTPGWNVPRMEEHVTAMHSLAERGGVDILVLGSSVVEAGIDADALTDELAAHASGYTVWVPGPPVRSLEIIYRDLAGPFLRPDLVVLGVSSRELNDTGQGQDRQYDALVTSPELQRLTRGETVAQRLDRIAGEYSAFLRLRGQLRDPGRVARALRARMRAGATVDANEDVPVELDNETFEVTEEHTYQERRALSGYTVGGEEAEALTRLLRDIRADGTDVLLVNIPVDESYVDLHPGGQDDLDRYEDLLERLAASEGVPYFNPMEISWETSCFSNQNHLNSAGEAKLTELVAWELEQLDGSTALGTATEIGQGDGEITCS